MTLHTFMATFLHININKKVQIQEGDTMKIIDKLDSELLLALVVFALYLTIVGFVLF